MRTGVLAKIQNMLGAIINPSTEEKQDDIITAVKSEVALILDDTTTTDVTYIGRASIGSATSGAVWQIKKIDESGDFTLTWADGDNSFDNIWDNRAILSYS